MLSTATPIKTPTCPRALAATALALRNDSGANQRASQHIADTLKQVEAAGVAEVILYFNYGQKPHALVKVVEAFQWWPQRYANWHNAAPKRQLRCTM